MNWGRHWGEKKGLPASPPLVPGWTEGDCRPTELSHTTWDSEGFPGGSDGKEPACHTGDASSIPGWGRSAGGEHGNPLQCACLENCMDRGDSWTIVHGKAESDTAEQLTRSLFTLGWWKATTRESFKMTRSHLWVALCVFLRLGQTTKEKWKAEQSKTQNSKAGREVVSRTD